MLTCRQATRLLSEAQDRPLALKEKAALRLHLMLCTGCRNFNRQIFTIRQISQAYAKRKGDDSGDNGQ